MNTPHFRRLGGILLIAALAVPMASAAHHEDDEEHHVEVIVSGDHDGQSGGNMTFGWVHEDAEAADPSAFLGVETARVSSTLTTQLGLDRGIGLVVSRVVPETAAATALAKHDILIKFDDQLLVSADQLGVLVRSKDIGTKVTLTIIRAGKQQTAEVELGERKAKKMSRQFRVLGDSDSGNAHGSVDVKVLRDHARSAGGNISREEVERLMQHVRSRQDEGQKMAWVTKEEGPVTRMLNVNQGNVVFSDEDGMVELLTAGGQKTLVVKSADGDVLFDGPISSEADRAKLSDALKQRLQKVESIEDIEFHTDSSFETDDVHIITPKGGSAQIIRPKMESHVVVQVADNNS
ncbi:PDZ domain-containing protein [Synoicihabitans lomoniglobus]|uniref:PDZ domain-containing protein n=1 Tax=Synoicihabitans lomoniglobus TaxID=2909285 RepID=A0AAE9ZWW8_9BACT|nr:PDZ domain-containing protein [Opitutaceae bacterium LMO-M01]WED64013.1 PDZ domain-containing protein [Opitutaceae bacterium LMO-M01]